MIGDLVDELNAGVGETNDLVVQASVGLQREDRTAPARTMRRLASV
jgi:hypothetical protein